MRISQENLNEVLNMPLQNKYTFYNALKIDHKELNQYYELIRYGIKQKFDIHDVFEENIIIKPKQGIVRIRGNTLKLEMFRTELEQREALIVKAILEHITEPNTIYKQMEE